jgi:dihydrolipoamide dehydrogenase
MDKYDVVVIGAGPGGYPAAIRAAQLGATVAIIEKEALGGTCLNHGCIPTKTLIASAEFFYHAQHADSLGIQTGNISFDYAAMVKRKDDVVAKLNGGITQLLKGNKVTVYKGTGSFVSRNRIAIQSGDKTTEIEAKNTIIATGTTSSMPGFLPQHDRVVESRSFLHRTDLPKSIIILGGGIIGCEFACMAAQLGTEVTIVEMLNDIMPMLDKDIRREARRVMEKELGIRILTGQSLQIIKADKKSVRGTCGDEKLSAAMLLVAVGRQPVTAGLNLPAAGIETNEAGFIPVDPSCKTRAATVYAIGDVNGGWQLAHAATSQGVTAAENAVNGTRKPMETLVPGCIFTTPEIGTVGLSEQEAKEQGRAVKVGKFMFGGLGKGMATNETGGFVKWVADAETDQLLGAHVVGAHATDLIGEATVAIRSELTAHELGATIHAHPTFAEAWMEAAHSLHGTCIHAAPKRR